MANSAAKKQSRRPRASELGKHVHASGTCLICNTNFEVSGVGDAETAKDLLCDKHNGRFTGQDPESEEYEALTDAEKFHFFKGEIVTWENEVKPEPKGTPTETAHLVRDARKRGEAARKPRLVKP